MAGQVTLLKGMLSLKVSRFKLEAHKLSLNQ